MASYTSHYNLKKPAGTEDINVNDINTNMDAIDAAIYSVADKTQMTVLFANWTATQTSSNTAKVTDDLSLSEGLWLVILTVPFASSGTPVVRIDGTSGFYAHELGTANGSGAQTMKVINVDSNGITIYGASSSSAVVTYDSAYFSRGGLVAVRLKKG